MCMSLQLLALAAFQAIIICNWDRMARIYDIFSELAIYIVISSQLFLVEILVEVLIIWKVTMQNYKKCVYLQ